MLKSLTAVVNIGLLVLISSSATAYGQGGAPSFPVFPEAVPDGGQYPSEFPATGEDLLLDHPTAQAPCYWTVSSRGLPQTPTHCASHRLGYFERLADGTIRQTSRTAMTSQMIPGIPICIFIHGSFVDVASQKVEAEGTYQWIRKAAPQLPAYFIFYTWPSQARCNTLASANPFAVNERGRWAEHNSYYVADLIAQLPKESPICLVGHSHGARVTVATLHLLAGGHIEGRTYPYDTGCNRRYRAVLAAGAIDRHWLNPGQRYDFAIRRVEGILNLVNHVDGALHFYPLRRPFSRKAIAVTGVTRWDQRRLGTLSNKIIDYDVTQRIGLGHFWPNYYDEPCIGLAISPYVYFTDSQLNPTYTLADGSFANPAISLSHR